MKSHQTQSGIRYSGLGAELVEPTRIWQQASQRSIALSSFKRYWQLYLVMLPALTYFIVFKYIPMVNAVLA